MRLIDADALDKITVTTDDYSGNEVLDVVLWEDIEKAPTIDTFTLKTTLSNITWVEHKKDCDCKDFKRWQAKAMR